MHANVTEPGGAVVPTLRYRDVAAAIDWLCNAFGFEKQLVVGGDDGAVRYAELTFGNGMIMLGPVEDSGLDKFMTQPADTGGAETQICYLFVADAAAHCARARAAGADIVLDIEDADSNGRGYSCRDLEGHIWNFGTYDPWRRRPVAAGASNRYPGGLRRGLRRLAAAAAMILVVIASAVVVGWALGVSETPYLDLGSAASTGVAEAASSTQPDQLAREATERAVKDIREQLARERGAREAAERLARGVREQLGQERIAREAAERAVSEVQAQLAREQSAKDSGGRSARADTERALEEARQQLARERDALEDAQRMAQEARDRLSLAERASETVQQQLAAERTAREAAELGARQTREQLAKEQSAKDVAERAAKEAREQESRERAARRPPPRPRPMQSESSGKPFIKWDQ